MCVFVDIVFAECKCVNAVARGSHNLKPSVTVSKKLRILISHYPHWETLYLVRMFNVLIA